ncbi:hypothetical protein H0H93_002709, partial [Arthromyces matolae]
MTSPNSTMNLYRPLVLQSQIARFIRPSRPYPKNMLKPNIFTPRLIFIRSSISDSIPTYVLLGCKITKHYSSLEEIARM